jgi:hypothetical protein
MGRAPLIPVQLERDAKAVSDEADIQAERDARWRKSSAYWDWANSREGRLCLAKRVDRLYQAPSALPDAAHESLQAGWRQAAIAISSPSADARIRVEWDAADLWGKINLFRGGVEVRGLSIWVLENSTSIGTTDAPFDADEKLVAALLRSQGGNFRIPETLSKRRTGFQVFADELKQEFYAAHPELG